jgi:hypothetical protein
MFAETEKEKDDWIGAIGRCVLSLMCVTPIAKGHF